MRSATEILDEIRTLKGLGSDAALGELFGVKQSTVASWRGRNSIPYEEIIAFCVKEGISIDGLFTSKAKPAAVAEVHETYRKAVDPVIGKINQHLEQMSEADRKAVEQIASTLAQCQKVNKKMG